MAHSFLTALPSWHTDNYFYAGGQARVIHVSEGKGKKAVTSIQDHLAEKGVPSEQIRQASMDLSPAFIAGVTASFPNAQITFDRFHVVKLLNEAMDTVRKAERKEHDCSKGINTRS